MSDIDSAKKFLYGDDQKTETPAKAKRAFPIVNLIVLIVLVTLQTAGIIFAILYEPSPQDRIDSYTVTVAPLDDGTLDIEYKFLWTPLDNSEELTWVEVGIANDAFSIYEDSVSDTVERAEKYRDGDYVSILLYFEKAYTGGEQFEFSFKINQSRMISSDSNGYHFGFVPGWFNAIPIDSYTFKWLETGKENFTNSDRKENGYYIWEGSMKPGDYRVMNVDYRDGSFTPEYVSRNESFDDEGAYNELAENKIGVVILVSVFCVIFLVAELYIIDSFVSYNRGRGFLRGYGHHVHTYGYINPLYRTAARQSSGSSVGGGRSGGCACACACACAGGGRAGCSQKDTYQAHKISAQNEEG